MSLVNNNYNNSLSNENKWRKFEFAASGFGAWQSTTLQLCIGKNNIATMNIPVSQTYMDFHIFGVNEIYATKIEIGKYPNSSGDIIKFTNVVFINSVPYNIHLDYASWITISDGIGNIHLRCITYSTFHSIFDIYGPNAFISYCSSWSFTSVDIGFGLSYFSGGINGCSIGSLSTCKLGGLYSCLFGGEFSNNIINGALSACKGVNNFKFNNFNGITLLSVDFTTASHVYNSYTCDIFERIDGTLRLQYVDNSDTIHIVPVTE